MRLYPSTIHSMCTLETYLSDVPGGSGPACKMGNMKLQVFTKDGCYYALDDNVLRAFQQLEANGLCGAVDVDVVGKNKIPSFLWQAAVCPTPVMPLDVMAADSSDSDSDNEQPEFTDTDLFPCACGANFLSVKDLTDHQMSRRHFGCLACGSVFPSLKQLNSHEDLTKHMAHGDSS